MVVADDDEPPRFNTQPPEGGWNFSSIRSGVLEVSTHSRPKAAGT